jgi:hypothetical protein
MSSSFSYQFFGLIFSGITKSALRFSRARFVPRYQQTRRADFSMTAEKTRALAVHNCGFDFVFLNLGM